MHDNISGKSAVPTNGATSTRDGMVFDGTNDYISLNHTYNSSQIDWYDEGSALNLIKKENL